MSAKIFLQMYMKSRSTQSYHRKKRELKEEESAKDCSLYGDISRFFQREGDCDRDSPDNHLTSGFTPRFLPPLFEKEFDEENNRYI